MRMESLYDHAEAIYRAGLARVDPVSMMRRVLTLYGDELRLATESRCLDLDLSVFDNVRVLGAGKASARMALGLERLLGERIAGGVVVVKDGCKEPLSRIRLMEASHPIPDERSAAAARTLLQEAEKAGPKDLVVVLISGGGSALLAAPLVDPAHPLTLADKQALTSLLLGCGATIQEINCVRKTLSAIKGGKLARAVAPAFCLSLILSDVVGDDLDAIASGPTAPDATSAADALDILERYDLLGKVPAAEALIRAQAEKPQAQTPFPANVENVIIGSNRQCLLAAADKARELGYEPLTLTSRLTGEAREMAGLFLALARDAAASAMPVRPPACILAGGETTVTLKGAGKGGRNQEMALAYLAGLARSAKDAGTAVYLQAATDGDDGPTDAAGAFASLEILKKGLSMGLNASEYLKNNDAYAYFSRLGRLLTTGPTKTNVCDVSILLIP